MNADFGDDLVDHHTYVIAGDGCLMEGISQEAISLAGHLKLNKLIVVWDHNNISIDGSVSLADSTDQPARFAASGWNTIEIDGLDPDADRRCVRRRRKNSDRPTLIAAKTIIGCGAPTKAGTNKAHGSPLGTEEIVGARKFFDWPYPPFEVPDDIIGMPGASVGRPGRPSARNGRSGWRPPMPKRPRRVRAPHARRPAGRLRRGDCRYKKKLAVDKPKVATRKSSEMALEVINGVVPETIGGSADLTGSNNTKTSQTKPLTAGAYGNRYIHYGIREHGMAAAMNGLSLHGGIIPYGGTFLCFSDYARPAMRLASLMGIRSIYVMTHDSIGLGEDGPTHQPVEHLAALRAIPNHVVYPPGRRDGSGRMLAARAGIDEDAVDAGADPPEPAGACAPNTSPTTSAGYGAYELAAANGDAVVTIFATGSEVEIALAARDAAAGARPSDARRLGAGFELFEAAERRLQGEDHRHRRSRWRSRPASASAGTASSALDGIFIGMTRFRRQRHDRAALSAFRHHRRSDGEGGRGAAARVAGSHAGARATPVRA